MQKLMTTGMAALGLCIACSASENTSSSSSALHYEQVVHVGANGEVKSMVTHPMTNDQLAAEASKRTAFLRARAAAGNGSISTLELNDDCNGGDGYCLTQDNACYASDIYIMDAADGCTSGSGYNILCLYWDEGVGSNTFRLNVTSHPGGGDWSGHVAAVWPGSFDFGMCSSSEGCESFPGNGACDNGYIQNDPPTVDENWETAEDATCVCVEASPGYCGDCPGG